MNRRSFLLAARAVILTPGLLMPVKVAGFTTGLLRLPNVYPVTRWQLPSQFYGRSPAVDSLVDLRRLNAMLTPPDVKWFRLKIRTEVGSLTVK